MKKLGFCLLLLMALNCWAQGRPERGLSEYPHARSSQAGWPILNLPGPLAPLADGLERDVTLARRRGDVSGLLSAARLLQNLDRLGTSPIAFDGLLFEALEMARDQRDLEALVQVSQLIRVPEQRAQAQRFQQELRDEQKAMQGKQSCRIIFHNRTGQPGLEIRLNTRPLGALGTGQSYEVNGLQAGRQVMDAFNDDLDWGPRRIFVGPGETFHWKLFR